MVRVVGIEPTLLAEPDFESGASTSSTTPARRFAQISRSDCPLMEGISGHYTLQPASSTVMMATIREGSKTS
jgi:hypothetical protein